MSDPYTMEARLCDDAGMVSHEHTPRNVFDPDLTYLRQLNNLRARGGLKPYEGEPFPCTGSAHLAHEHIRCTSPAHTREAVPMRLAEGAVLCAELGHLPLRTLDGKCARCGGSMVGTVTAESAVLSPAGSAVVCVNGYCHVCGDSLVKTQGVLFCCRCQADRGIPAPSEADR